MVDFFKKVLQNKKYKLYLQSHSETRGNIFGVWRSWLAHLVWDQRVQCSSHCTPTKQRRMTEKVILLCFVRNPPRWSSVIPCLVGRQGLIHFSAVGCGG